MENLNDIPEIVKPKQPLFSEVENFDDIDGLGDFGDLNIVTLNLQPPDLPKDVNVDITEFSTAPVEIPMTLVENEKKQLIEKINQFKETFPKLDFKKVPRKLTTLGLVKLKEVMESLESQLKTQNSNKLVTAMFFQLTYLIETSSTNYTPVDLTGYTDKLREQEAEIDKLLAQLAYTYYEQIKYFANPEVQLLLIMLITGLTTFQKNRVLNKMLEQAETKEDKDRIKLLFASK